MAVRVKICGLKRQADVDWVNEACPDYAGFVFAQSRRRVEDETAAALSARLLPSIVPVGVFVDEPPEHILKLASRGVIRMIQLHGSEPEEMVSYLKERSGLPVIKALRVAREADLKRWERSRADYLLFDGGSGDGIPFDWEKARAIAGLSKPFFLAGGLTAENVREGIRIFSPYAVDVSSGVEEDGGKSRDKILSFTRAVREA